MMAASFTQSLSRLILILVSTFCPALYGGFRPEQQVITTDANEATCVYAADLDGDGDLDVLSASYGSPPSYSGKIAWYANDGSGQFGPERVITTAAAGANCVYAADLDGDGDLDVVSASYNYDPQAPIGKIAWYANDGTGRFGPEQVIMTGPWANCVYAADIDGDGDLDVLLAGSMIAWYANDGSGRFGPQQVISSIQGDGGESVYAGDLDGDGDLDVLSASYDHKTDRPTKSKIAWYVNDGTGQFGPQQVITMAARGADCVYAADLDGDGDLDVLSASYADNKIAWYANDGTGRFGPQQVITTAARWARCVYAADLDGDGDLDVLSASSWDDKIAWYENDTAPEFGNEQVITTEADGANCVYAADLDGDGDLDVLSASAVDGKIAWYANDGSGHFGPQQVITTATVEASCVYAADLDGDGDLDVLAALGYMIAWYANDGSGHFGPTQVIATAADGAYCVYAADLDGDGDLDVLAPLEYMIAWYANDGSGHFGPQQIITWDADGTESVYAADLDGDGDLDVLSASSSGYSNDGEIAWYANDGTGHFGPSQVISTEAGQRCVYAADLDADGDLDVLSASAFHSQIPISPGEIAWYANDGSGHFGREQIIAARGYGAECVYAADLDGDGDLDVVSASSLDRKIAWYENE